MRIAIVDDEQKWRDVVVEVVKKYIDGTDEIETFDSGMRFLEKNEKYDIVLMDVEMPGMDGFETIINYKAEHTESIIVVLTTHLECARRGYLVNAFRYVDKTKMEDELEEAFEKIREMKRERDFFVTVKDDKIVKNIFVRDILFIEAHGKGSQIYTVEKCYKSNKKIGQLEIELEKYGFYRCHKSFLIHLNVVDYLDKEFAYFQNNRKAYISARKYVETKKKYIAAKKRDASM